MTAAAADVRDPSVTLALWALPNAVMVSMINVALPEIREDFDVSPGSLTWVATAYIIAGAIGAVLYGRLADVFGLRRVGLACLVGFAVTGVAASLAPSFGLLVLLRFGQGLTGMALPSLASGGTVALLTAERRPRAIGLLMASFGLGLLIGSLVGGVVIGAAGWRAPFFVVAASTLILVPVTRVVIAPVGPRTGELRFDRLGGLLVTIAVGATLLAANQLPRVGRLQVGLVAAVFATVFWVTFLRHIRRVRHPFVDPVVVSSRPFLRSCALGGLAQAQFVAAGFLLPLGLRAIHGYSVAAVGLLLSVGFATVLLIGVLGPRLVRRLGNRTILLLSASCLGAAAIGATLFGISSTLVVVLLYALLGAAYSLAQPILINAAARLLPAGYAGAGMGFYNFAYFAAGAFSVALSGGLLERRSDAESSFTGWFASPEAGYADALVLLPVLALLFVAVLVRLLGDPGMERASTRVQAV